MAGVEGGSDVLVVGRRDIITGGGCPWDIVRWAGGDRLDKSKDLSSKDKIESIRKRGEAKSY